MRMRSFILIIHHTRFYQIYYSIAEHFCVNTQIFMIIKTLQNSIWNSPNSHLQYRTVFDDFSNVSTNLQFFLFYLRAVIYCKQFCFVPYHFINLAHVDYTVSMSSRHFRVYLSDYIFRCIYCGSSNIHRKSKRTISVLIWRRNLDNCYI